MLEIIFSKKGLELFSRTTPDSDKDQKGSPKIFTQYQAFQHICTMSYSCKHALSYGTMQSAVTQALQSGGL